MDNRPLIYISAVSAEHRSLRATVAKTLKSLGFRTVFQEIQGGKKSDVIAKLGALINECDGVVQLVGHRYGIAPANPHHQFGEVSYAQFESIYPRSRNKKVWHILIEPPHPSDADPRKPETPREQALQLTYRQSLNPFTVACHPSRSVEETKKCLTERFRPDFDEILTFAREREARVKKKPRPAGRTASFKGFGVALLICLVAAGIYYAPSLLERARQAVSLAVSRSQTKADAGGPSEAFVGLSKDGNALYMQGVNTEGPDGLELLKQAVSVYRGALSAQARESQPQEWAATQNNLASALALLGERTQGPEAAALLGQAVTAYRATLEVTTRQSQPQAWATIQNNLANALCEQGRHISGEKGMDLLRESVRAHRSAMEVSTRDTQPQTWAKLQSALGDTLTALGDAAGANQPAAPPIYYREAEAAYSAALEIFKAPATPEDQRRVQEGLDLVRSKLKAIK